MAGFIINIIFVIVDIILLIILEKLNVYLERKQFKKWAKDNKYEFILSKYSEYEEENKL